MNISQRLRQCARHTGLDAVIELLNEAADEIDDLQARAQAQGEPVYWEWRHQGSHPDAVDFGQWSEWKRVEPRSALHTVEDALNEFRGYITRGHKYELRSLYTHPAPGVPDDVARDAERYRWRGSS